MMQFGFASVPCGVEGPSAWETANTWEERWQAARKGLEPHLREVFPRNSVGDAFERYRRTNAWASKSPRTREDWDRGWKYIKPFFADVAPATITMEMLDAWYARLIRKHGVGEAYRGMKTWRALYNVMASFKLCVRGADPSAVIRRRTVAGRTATWAEGEAVRLVKQAWRSGYKGLACVAAVAWDTGFAPVDARSLTPGQVIGIRGTWGFKVARAKTGEPALGTLSRRTRKLIETYVSGLGFDLLDDTPIFRTRGYAAGPRGGRPRIGAPFTKNSLSDDFAAVRTLVFGPDENRKLMDMRRSGAVESLAGGATAESMAAKLANSVDQNKALWKTYLPVDHATVGGVDDARRRGRALLRTEQTGDKKLKLADQKS